MWQLNHAYIQPLSGESLNLASANTTDGARLNVCARGFWNVCQDAYFDIRVFHPNAPSNKTRSLSAIYKRHEDEKKRTYNQCVQDIEHGVFTPLILSTTGGMAREAETFYNRLADMLSQKRDLRYSWLATLHALLCQLQISYNVHQREQILNTSPHQRHRRHSPCLLRGHS